MEQIVKQSFGIDIAKKDFTASLASYYPSGKIRYSTAEVFDNSKKGFNRFLKWCNKVGDKGSPPAFMMEPTGV